MYQVLVLVSIGVASVWAIPEEEIRHCMRLTHPSSTPCCKWGPGMKPIKNDNNDGLEDCLKLDQTFDREICLATKRGYATSDGKINKNAVKGIIKKEFANNQDLMKNIIDKCVDGDLETFGMAYVSDIMKLKFCMDTQFIMSCPKWDNEGICLGMRDLAEECIKKFM